MANTIYSVDDGTQYTVSDLLGAPKAIAKPIVDYLVDWDLTSAIFEDVGSNNGSVAYEKDPAPFTEDGLETVAEFAEFPSTRPVAGEKILVAGEKEGRWLDISYEMRDENQVNQVQRALLQFRNAAALSSYRRLKAVLEASEIGTVTAAAAWKDAAADPLGDTSEAIELITDAVVPGVNDDEATYGFDPDTMVIPRSLAGTFVRNEEFRAAYTGALAADNPIFTGYKGVTKFGFNGLQIIIPKFWYRDRILVLDSDNKPGFVSDTRPLAMTGPHDDPKRETVGYKLARKRILGVDRPKAAKWITGVKA